MMPETPEIIEVVETPSWFVRKPFKIQAIRVTRANMSSVAEWCNGDIIEGGSAIKVKVFRPKNERMTMAFIGDWVTKSGTAFKVYEDGAFRASFDSAASDKFKALERILKDAFLRQETNRALGALENFDKVPTALAQDIHKLYTQVTFDPDADKKYSVILATIKEAMQWRGTVAPNEKDFSNSYADMVTRKILSLI